jgi:hypothetical protein
MTSRERIRKAVNHEQTDRPIETRNSFITTL